MPDSDRALARQVLDIVPLVMRTVAAEMRRQGSALPPTHHALPAMLAQRPHSLGELAEKLGVSAPTMSNLIATLADRGWVTRHPGPGDRRVSLIELTPEGCKALEENQERAEARVAAVLAQLSPAKQQALREGLAVLREAFEPTLSESEMAPAGEGSQKKGRLPEAKGLVR